MKKYRFLLLLLLSIGFLNSGAQSYSNATGALRIGIFAPLYLDSVFTDNDYSYGKNFPRFVVPGLDFIQGAQVAFDSMPSPASPMDIRYFDSKSEKDNINSLIENKKLDSLQLIIGSVKDDDFKTLAAFAADKHIPFISATYPNDGGQTNNPYLIIINSTLKAHCEAIFSYILQNHGTDKIILVRKTGSQEDKVAGYFSSLNKPDGKALLNIQSITLDSNYNAIRSKLDTLQKNIIIGGSLDEDFAYNLAAALAPMKKKADITLLGMPNWDGFQSFNGSKKNINDFPVYFTATYFNSKWDNYSRMIQDLYLSKYKGKPSEYAYKGFETAYLFTRLLIRYPDNFMEHLNDYAYKIFSEYNFKPVYLKKTNSAPDYFENKHLYFLKNLNGVISKAW